MYQRIRSARAWWRTYSAAIRFGALMLWTLSAILLSLGVVGDVFNWWERFPFTINLLSSAAGASFGLPLAVLVLNTLVTQRAASLGNQAAARLAYRAMRRIAETLSSVSPTGGSTDTDGLLGNFYRLREQVAECRALGKLSDPVGSQALIQEIGEALSEAFPSVNQIGERVVIAQLNWELLVTHASETVDRQPLISDDVMSRVGLLLKELGRMDVRILDPNELFLALEPIMRMETHPDIHPSAVETRYMIRHVDDVDLAVRLMQRTADIAPSIQYAASALENRPSST